ncbi:MAG: NACHT domain-containing protein [Rickettsiales bacterium]
MTNKLGKVDKTRASRDGHEFHENWAARQALKLLWPQDNFIGLSIEGPNDQDVASDKTVQIADVTLYYGKKPTFKDAKKVVIVQLKYSISHEQTPFRASNAKKTIQKFAASYKDHKKNHGEKETNEKLEFELVTNRPLYSPLTEAIESIAKNKDVSNEVKKEVNQFKTACDFDGKELIDFAQRISFSGLAGNLRENKRILSRVIADWSTAQDHISRARLVAIKQLLRDKAGVEGQQNNVIERLDILDRLEVSEEDLFPCSSSFPEVGSIVEREQLSDVINLISKSNKPFLIHAAGGVGKTVFLQSIARHYSDEHEVILFDCFGRGSYRLTGDSRHRPKKAFTHIINILASKGLCDPMIPSHDDPSDLIKTFISRIKQATNVLQRSSFDKRIILFIDAIDNAADSAQDKREDCFVKVLLESFENYNIPNFSIVLTCRTHRIDLAKGDFSCEEYQLKPFSLKETEIYLRNRINNINSTEIEVAFARSGGNPRVLEHLALSDRGLLDKSEINKTIELDELLKNRISDALKEAKTRGYKESDIGSFLAGLSTLPPPVPLREYAAAQNMEESAIESFVADLAPLLEKTKHGIWFRDEPTETLIRKDYASNDQALRKVAENLFKQQDNSVYSAQALPGLLQKIGDGEKLFELAFDERFPAEITSNVGKQTIRYARLKAAAYYDTTTSKNNYDHLVNLLVELSTIEASNQRGKDYILANPDLIVASDDIDAKRRLFEIRTSWQGTRHARLAIAHILSDEKSEAYRHSLQAEEWINHFSKQKDDYRRDRKGYEIMDIAAIPLCLLSQGKNEEAANWMNRWKCWGVYEISENLFSFIKQSKILHPNSAINEDKFLKALAGNIGLIVGALSFYKCSDNERKKLIKNLAKTCKDNGLLEVGYDDRRSKNYIIQDGLFKASSIALSLGLKSEVTSICSVLKIKTPSLHSFNNIYSGQYIVPFIIRKAIDSVAGNYVLSAQDILPEELEEIWAAPDRNLGDAEFKERLKKEIAASYEKSQKEKKDKNEKESFSYDTKTNAERFLSERLPLLTKLAKSLAELLSTPIGKADDAFINLIQAWSDSRNVKILYHDSQTFDFLGQELIAFSIWSRDDLCLTSIKKFCDVLNKEGFVSAHYLVKIVSILSEINQFHELAGEMATKASSIIEKENDVNNRAAQYAKLSRAILPASIKEAASYFKAGLDQMDVIGSGDYDFTNELLLFAASLKGQELEDKDFHTLTNICELNMWDGESHKFPWYAFAQGLSKTSGCKALAKLGRWDDRNKVGLEHTLMPYLIALLKDKKIEADIALALLRLCDPSETWSYDFSHFAQAIENRSHPNQQQLVREILAQFEENNSGRLSDAELQRLHTISAKVFGETDEETVHLAKLRKRSKIIVAQQNENSNYKNYNYDDPKHREEAKNRDKENKKLIQRLIDKADPLNEEVISEAIYKITEVQSGHMLEKDYLSGVRTKVRFGERSSYIKIISRIKHLFYYRKIEELKACKDDWKKSSNSLDTIFSSIADTILDQHSDELIFHDRLSTSNLNELSELCSVPITTLAMRLIKIFSGSDIYISAPVWMSLASIICEKSGDGEGQKALVRLLNSGSTKLSSNVSDGEWKENMYPPSHINEIASGLVWLKLGSPSAADRWRAAHSIRRFAKLGRWDVIEALISKIETKNAHPFQAPELTFYHLHAKLWLLIALARLALDYPKEVTKYSDAIKKIALDKDFPHVLMRHFSSYIIKKCVECGHLTLSTKEKKEIESVNKSPYPRLKEKRRSGSRGWHENRPDNIPEMKSEFYLDHDFGKYDVQRLSDVFGKYGWEMNDIITKWVRIFDKDIKSMYTHGGRNNNYGRREIREITSKYHSYGNQLGWNALFLAAGQLLAECPITNDSYYEDDPWAYFLNREILTRNDGLWLSDGLDKTPLDANINLLEQGKEGLVITGNKDIILGLLGITSSKIDKEIIVDGNWISSDEIQIKISSALVIPEQAKNEAIKISKEDPFQAWLPIYHEGEEDEYMRDDKENFKAWIVQPSAEVKIDNHDALGARSVMERPYFAQDIVRQFALRTDDPFRREWKSKSGKILATAEAWQAPNKNDRETYKEAVRLKCSKSLLQKVLEKKKMSLLLFVELQQYKESSSYEKSFFMHTTAAITIGSDLKVSFYEGHVSRVHNSKH